MVVLALQPKGYAASLFYTPFDRTSFSPKEIGQLKKFAAIVESEISH